MIRIFHFRNILW